ncbi:MAG TPA: LamG-like jellyroll fold domain-containing protein [Myxococcaceae bacterium]|nr:LamG-like jellyroll fold domain-containing protein [Myxococcaceae bacterium]
MSDVTTQRGVLSFEKNDRLALPGFSEGFAEGLTVQLWVLLHPGENRQRRILELGGGLFLGVGKEPNSLVLGVTGPEGEKILNAPGALPMDRWVHLSAVINAQGHATLYAQGVRLAEGPLQSPGTLGVGMGCVGRGERTPGFEGEVAQLALWRGALAPEPLSRPRPVPLRGDEPGLAAYYPLDALVETQALELTSGQRHGSASGNITALPGSALSEAMADVPHAVSLSGTESWLQLPPLAPEAFSKGLSVQAWLRPRSVSGPLPLLELSAGPEHDALLIGAEDSSGALYIDTRTVTAYDPDPTTKDKPRPRRERICLVPGVLATGRWAHLSAVLDPNKQQCTVFINGRSVHQAPLPQKAFASKQVHTHCYLGRHDAMTAVTFAGELAEVRLWRMPLSPEQVARTWGSRLRGDERELLACYRLDSIERGLAIDTSARRVHARTLGPVTVVPADGLPLRSVTREGQPGVTVSGKLLTDWVPYSVFAPASNATRYGTVQGSLVRCSSYEIVIEPRNAAGEPVGGEHVELCLDEGRDVLRSEGGRSWLESWPASTVRSLKVPDGGRLRLCILAGKALDCPSVRVRRRDMPSDAWVVARPADASQEALLGLNGDQMLAPKDGHAPVFSSKTSRDDANAVAELLRNTAMALPVSAATPLKSMRKSTPDNAKILSSIGNVTEDVWNGVTQGVESAIQQAERALRQASDLVMDSTEDIAKLMKAAAKVPAQVGAEAARQCIRGAKKLYIDAGESLEDSRGAVWGVVQLVGEHVVNGSKKVFRVVVSGVAETLLAIEELALKVGTAIEKLVDYLSRLFQWHRFLHNAERIYDMGLRMLDRTREQKDVLADLPAMIDRLMSVPGSSEVAKKTLGQMVGLTSLKGLPDFDELKYLVDQIESAFSGNGFSVENHKPQKRQQPQSVNMASSSSTSKQCVQVLPPELFVPSDGLLAIPMRPLMEAPANVWKLARPDCVPLLEWIHRELDNALKDAHSVLTQRLSVPVLTELVETVILGGKKMNLLRLVSLIGAIPMTLAPSSGKKSTASSTTKSTQEKSTQKEEDDEVVRYLQCSVSIANAVLSGCRAGAENADADGAEKAVRILFGVSSAFSLVSAGVDFYLASKETSQTAKACAFTHATIATAAGAWLGVMTVLWEGGEDGGGGQTLDLIVELVLGLGEVATAIAEVSTKVSSPQELGNIGFQLGAWSLRGLQRVFDGCDNAGGGDGLSSKIAKYSKGLNYATCAGMFVLEAVECGLYAEGKLS